MKIKPEKIRELRREYSAKGKLSQTELGGLIGLSLPGVQKIESGKARPNQRTVLDLRRLQWHVVCRDDARRLLGLLGVGQGEAVRNLSADDVKGRVVFTVRLQTKSDDGEPEVGFRFLRTEALDPFAPITRVRVLEERKLDEYDYLQIFYTTGIFDHRCVVEEIFDPDRWRGWCKLLGRAG